jgi:hypothetical protein
VDRYRDMTAFVEAIQWFPGDEEGRVRVSRYTGYLPGDFRIKTFETYTFVDGRVETELHPGDWIVVIGGKTAIVRKDDFNRKYKLVAE